MKLTFKNLQAYYIHPENFKDRTEALLVSLNKLDVKSTTRIISNEEPGCKQNNTTRAHLKMIEKIIEDNSYPCLFVEDDIKFIKDLPLEFEVPDEADMIYLGGSLYNDASIKPDLYITEYNDIFYRVYYMFTTHAIVIMNNKTALEYKKVCEQGLKDCKPNDVDLSLMSKDFIALTPKDGLYLYQYGENQDITKFQWKQYEDVLLKKL
jgi:hypothetical protein